MYLLHNFTLDIFQPRENKFYGNRSNRCNWSVITKSVMATLQQKCANGLFCTQEHAQKLFTLRFKLKTSRSTWKKIYYLQKLDTFILPQSIMQMLLRLKICKSFGALHLEVRRYLDKISYEDFLLSSNLFLFIDIQC